MIIFMQKGGGSYLKEYPDQSGEKAHAEAVGISRQTMNAIEQGEFNPTIRLCRAICRALGKTLDDLFWEEESSNEEK